MKLNCDLGESFGAWQMGQDPEIMPLIDQANVACGFHAGDPAVMQNTLKLVKQHGVTLGAHPSYPDLQGFGRRSMQLDAQTLIAMLHYQIAALDGMAQVQGLSVSYVKPHGALYNDLLKSAETRRAVMQALASYPKSLVLMIQATPDKHRYQDEAQALGLALWFEAFADRAYDDNGHLVSRREPGAVLSLAQTQVRIEQLLETGEIQSVSGKPLPLAADSLCVHGDSADALLMVKSIRAQLSS